MKLETTFNKEYYYVDSDKLLYISRDSRNTVYHLPDIKVISTTPLDKINLPNNFVCCHVSFFVNVDCIYRLSKTEIELTNGKIIPISRQKQNDAIEIIRKKILDD